MDNLETWDYWLLGLLLVLPTVGAVVLVLLLVLRVV
jgi:hypothetical protein